MQVDLIGRINNTALLSQMESQTYSKPTKLTAYPYNYNMGYFSYNDSLTTYIEIISFDKLIIDTRKRNQILLISYFYLKHKQLILSHQNEGGEDDAL